MFYHSDRKVTSLETGERVQSLGGRKSRGCSKEGFLEEALGPCALRRVTTSLGRSGRKVDTADKKQSKPKSRAHLRESCILVGTEM